MTSREAQRLLLEAARAAPSADNSQPWCFRIDGNRLHCAYRKRDAFDPFGAGGHATLISVGAVAENLCQLLGGDVGIDVGDLATGDPYFSLSLDGIEQQIDPAARAHPLFLRHTNRFAYRDEPLPPQLLSDLAGMAEGTARLELLSDQEERQQFAAIAEVCCRARFCNRELHEWLMDSLRWSNEEAGSNDGLDVATLDLPPGGKSFMRLIRPWRRMKNLNQWVKLYQLMAMTEVRPLRKSPTIVCVVGEDTPRGAFTAGRLMERAWIHLNSQGIAIHPYYVIADQQTRLDAGMVPSDWEIPVRNVLAGLVDLYETKGVLRLHIAIRAGFPNVRPPISKRLELSALMK